MEHLSEGSTETILGVRKIACSANCGKCPETTFGGSTVRCLSNWQFWLFQARQGCFFCRGWILKECSRETDLSPGASSSTLACPSGQSKLLLEKRNKAVSCISPSSSPCCSWEALRSCSADTLHKRIHPDPLHKALPPKNLKLLHIFGPHTRTVVIFYGQFN